MAELQKFIQASNGAYKSDLMKSFVAKYKEEGSQGMEAVPVVGSVSTGAGLFPPPTSTSPSMSLSTPASSFDLTPGNDDANANVILQPDNAQTRDNVDLVEIEDNGNANTINVNINTTTTTTSSSTITSSEEPDTNANVTEVSAVLEEVRGEVPECRQELVAQVTQATVRAHLDTCINTHKAVKDARARFMVLKEGGQLPDMSKLSLSSSAMWEKMMAQLMPEMGQAINFCKLLPGFSELCLDDQMLLVKQGMFDVMMTRFSMLIDHEQETMLDPSHKMVCPRHVVQEMPMGKFLDGFFNVGAQFNPLRLTDQEIGVFTAVLAFNPKRPGLKERQLVTTLQSLYHQALYDLLKISHSDPATTFTNALGLVPMFSRVNREHSQALASMKMQSPEAFNNQFPLLHKELFLSQQ